MYVLLHVFGLYSMEREEEEEKKKKKKTAKINDKQGSLANQKRNN